MTVVDISGKKKKEGPMMEKIIDPVLLERVQSAQAWLIEEHKAKETWKKVAAEIGGYDESSINLFSSGMYPGNASKMLNVIEQARDFLEDRQNNVFHPRYVDTSIAKLLRRAFKQTRGRGALGVVSSDSGAGKSTTWWELQKTDKRLLILRANPTLRYRPWPLIAMLLKVAGEGNWEGKQPSRAFDVMVETFKSSKKDLIIDEAQFISRDGLDLLRCLSEQAEISILFSGNAAVHEQGLMYGAVPAAFVQFQSRCMVDEHVTTGQITRIDTDAISSQLLSEEVLDEEVSDALHTQAQAAGGFRRLTLVLQRALERARSENVTRSHVMQVVRDMRIPVGAA
jgi:DNA transposition AAA+ family ATPase